MVQKFELKKFEFKKNLKKKFEKKIFFLVRTYVKPNVVFSKIPFTPGGGGGGSKNQSCSEWRETWSRFGIFEIR